MQNVFPSKRKSKYKRFGAIRIKQSVLAEDQSRGWTCRIFHYRGMQENNGTSGVMIQVK